MNICVLDFKPLVGSEQYVFTAKTPIEMRLVFLGLGIHYDSEYLVDTRNLHPENFGELINELKCIAEDEEYVTQIGSKKFKFTMDNFEQQYKGQQTEITLYFDNNSIEVRSNEAGYILNFTNEVYDNTWLFQGLLTVE